MTLIEEFLRHLLGIEGDFSNHPHDTGGKTKYGITEGLARAYKYKGPMSHLPKDLAFNIYEAEFFKPMLIDRVAQVSKALAWEMFEFGVHGGTKRSVRTLQRLLNAMNLRGLYWPDLTVDGEMGPNTLGALRSYAHRRGAEGLKVMVHAFNGIQIEFYLSLVEDPNRHERDETWFYGWLLQRGIPK